MKILFVHNYYRSSLVGGEDIAFNSEVEAIKKEIGPENVFTYTTSSDSGHALGLLFNIWFSRKHYTNVYSLVKKHHIDIVHVHNFFPFMTPSVFKAAKKAGAMVVHTLHNFRWWCISGILYRDCVGNCEKCVKKRFAFNGVLNKCYHNSFIESLFIALVFLFYRLIGILQCVDAFFVLTNFELRKVEQFGISNKKLYLKPNVIDVSCATRSLNREDYIYVGRLDSNKGIEMLLDIWQTLDPRYVLKIVGGSAKDNRWKKYAKSNIIFLGKMSHCDTMHEIGRSRYLIHPSLMYETAGLTMLEALSLGVPVIGINTGTRPEFIKDMISGFLAEVDTLESIIRQSLNYAGYENMCALASESAQSFKGEVVASHQVQVYKKILQI